MQSLILQNLPHPISIIQTIFHCLHSSSIGYIVQEARRSPSIDYFVWCESRWRFPRSVVPKSSPCQPYLPFIQFHTKKTSQIALQALIDPLRLSIGLRMISRAKIELQTLEFEEFPPKRTRTPDLYQTWWTSASCTSGIFLNEKLLYLWSRERVLHRNKVGQFGIMVDHHHDSILPMAHRQPFHEVHWYILPHTHRKGQGL